jgi:hypothetical protein
VLPEAAIPEETIGNEIGNKSRKSFGGANLGMTSNIDLLEERSERDLVTGRLNGNGAYEPRGVDAVEKELASGLEKSVISEGSSRPRSGTGDARVQEAQQKAAGECHERILLEISMVPARPSRTSYLPFGGRATSSSFLVSSEEPTSGLLLESINTA